MILKTHCITFPRSGHHYLVRLLRAYFGEELRYHEPYLNEGDPGTANFLKDHDFDLARPVRADERYLVMVRNPVESVVSWIRMDTREGAFEPGSPVASHFFERLNFWRRFVGKWVAPGFSAPRHLFYYEAFLDNPQEEFSRVVKFLTEEPADRSRVQEALFKNPVRVSSPARPEKWCFADL